MCRMNETRLTFSVIFARIDNKLEINMDKKREIDDYQKAFIFLLVLSILFLGIPIYFIAAEVVPTAKDISVWKNGETVEATITNVWKERSHDIRFRHIGSNRYIIFVSYEYTTKEGVLHKGETPVVPYSGEMKADYVGKPLEIRIDGKGGCVNYNPGSGMLAVIFAHLLPSFIAPAMPMIIYLIFVKRKSPSA